MAKTNVILPYYEPSHPNFKALAHFLMHDDNDSTPLNLPPVTGDEMIMHPDDSSMQTFMVDDMFKLGFQRDPSTVHAETNIGSSDFGNPNQLSTWPPYTCSCCQILREITHTNGVDITNLEIHGRLGVIFHAVLDTYCINLTTNQSHEYKMFDFCKESTIRVERFLIQYCKERKLNAYIMLRDPLSSFYEAVCVGLDWEDSTMVTDLIHQDSGFVEKKTESSGAAIISVNKTSLSIQRERTGKLTIRDLVGYFHLPIEVAAKKIQICPTVIKKVCRKHGLLRWPYRKINCIEKKISMRARYLTSIDAEERGSAQDEIDALQQEISDIYSMVNV